MNKQIEELIAKSTQRMTGFDYKFGNTIIDYFDKEKFAELIIVECAAIAQKYMSRHLEDHALTKQIKQHFGVEE